MKKNFGIVTFPGKKEELTPLSNLIKIICPLSENLYLITGNFKVSSSKSCNLHKFEITHEKENGFIKRIFNYLLTQVMISIRLLKLKEVNSWIFFIGGDTLILPMITAKILRKKVLLLFPGSSIETLKSSDDKFYKIAEILSNINCKLANKIILYSPHFIKAWKLEKYKSKILIGHEHFLNFHEFKIKKEHNKRSNLIGYIGRLSEEKGILNFIKAIPKLIENDKNIKFLIVGDGYLKNEIKVYIEKNGLKNEVTLLEWIPHNEVSNCLNKLKLLVIPSYTEGLPNVMIEAMACGTPVLTTPVGAIPDIIKDKNTGFIIDNYSEDSISLKIVDSLNYSNIDEIIKNSYDLVREEFLYENALKKWDGILNKSD